MKSFPMFLKMTGRRVVIVGGGELAVRKVRLVLKTEAEIVVAAGALDLELAALADAGRLLWRQGPLTSETFLGAVLVFIATGCPGGDAAAHAIAKTTDALVNVVDAPALCDAYTPAIVDRDPVVVAIGSEGTAPVLTRQIKTRLEEIMEPRLGELAAIAARLRSAATARFTPKDRRAFWRWAFSGAPRLAHRAGEEHVAAEMLTSAITSGIIPEPAQKGFVSLVGAGPGSSDLITLRGVQRMQEADIIFYDRLIDDSLLELARRDAERVFVGKTPGACAWPQDRINGVIVAAARQGKSVVRLKCGDPGVFARGAEEAAALDAASVEWEIVPGVTAASAASAAAGRFLTKRGETNTLVLTTGHPCADASAPDWSQSLQPGVTMAIYMGIKNAGCIQRSLLAAGHNPNLTVDIACAVGTPAERHLSTDLGGMDVAIAANQIKNPAIIFVSHPIIASDKNLRRPDQLAISTAA